MRHRARAARKIGAEIALRRGISKKYKKNSELTICGEML